MRADIPKSREEEEEEEEEDANKFLRVSSSMLFDSGSLVPGVVTKDIADLFCFSFSTTIIVVKRAF